jgi:hypothetical protein
MTYKVYVGRSEDSIQHGFGPCIFSVMYEPPAVAKGHQDYPAEYSTGFKVLKSKSLPTISLLRDLSWYEPIQLYTS